VQTSPHTHYLAFCASPPASQRAPSKPMSFAVRSSDVSTRFLSQGTSPNVADVAESQAQRCEDCVGLQGQSERARPCRTQLHPVQVESSVAGRFSWRATASLARAEQTTWSERGLKQARASHQRGIRAQQRSALGCGTRCKFDVQCHDVQVQQKSSRAQRHCTGERIAVRTKALSWRGGLRGDSFFT
jgi:hypothetical protein